jgi:DNA recombination protein RmuC
MIGRLEAGGWYMADHLLIGILIGMASGIVALLVISALTLRRFDVTGRLATARLHRAVIELQRSAERAERDVREDIAATRRELETATRDSRDEAAHGARALRDEITGGLKGVSDSLGRGLTELTHLQQGQTDVLSGRLVELTDAAAGALRDHPLPALSSLAEAQERQLGALAAELRGLADVLDTSLDDVRSQIDERLHQLQTDHRDSLDQVRAEAVGHAKDLRNDMLESLRMQIEQIRMTVDEKIETTLERRVEESFTLVSERLQLVSERLEQVHRGLGEVQTFAAGLGNIQRALTNVRLGASKTRGQTGAPAEEAGGTPRAIRRKSKAIPEGGSEAVETERAPHALRAQQ